MVKINCTYVVAALLGLSIAHPSLAAYAELEKPAPSCTAVLCGAEQPGGIYGSITALYLKPSETGLGLVTDSWLFGTTARSKPVDVDHKWAGSVKLGYDLPMSANNIEANYLYLHNKTHAVNDFSNGSNGFGSILFPDAAFPPTPGFVSNAYLTYEINQADLKLGRKYSDLSGNFFIRPSLGVRYAKIEHKLTFAAPGNMISRFDGAGPMFSLDGNYQLGHGFGLVGYFDYSLIVGQANAHSFVNLGGTNFGFTWPERDRIVNNVTGKIGLDYNYAFSNDSAIGIEAGYQVNEYFDSMDTIRGTLPLAAGVIQRVHGYETNSFGIHGPYLSLNFHLS